MTRSYDAVKSEIFVSRHSISMLVGVLEFL